MFNGQGGYTWSEVYSMPIWLREFTFQKLKEHYNKVNTKSQNNNPKTKGPDINPSYSTKASQK